MAKWCRFIGAYVLYADCLECDDKWCDEYFGENGDDDKCAKKKNTKKNTKN